jgi:anthranilate synthase component 1
MYYPALKEFLKLSQKANVIPVYKEISADLDTPVSAFLKIKKDDYAFLLESVEGQEKIARYSFLGSNPALILRSKGKNIQITSNPGNSNIRFVTVKDPLEEIKKIMQDFKSAQVQGLPRFHGGFVGYISYDTVRFFEEIPDKNPDDLRLPDTIFILTDSILAFDHINHTIKIIVNVILPKKKPSLHKREQFYYQALKKK